MKRMFHALLVALVIGCLPAALQAQQQVRKLPLSEFRDKMKGAWLGQMIGVGYGAPTEFKVTGAIIPDAQMPPWKPSMVNQHGNDDCYVEMTFLKTLDTYGLDCTARQAGIDFANSGYPLWHANKAGRENLRRGIAPPDSGHPQFSKHADDIDYQIEADFSGIIAPGLPNQVIALGEVFGRLMNYGDGLYGGQFVGGMYAAAYFESDIGKIIEAGLACIPAQSQYAEMVRDMLVWHKKNPADWEKTWQLVEDKYHKNAAYTHGLCGRPGGKGNGSIDAKLNGAYILMGLLYGNGDPEQTIRISCRCGQDSDCNPSNAAGVLFAAMGASKIPPRYLEELDAKAKFDNSDYDLPAVYDLSEKLARAAVLKAGGKIERQADGQEVFVIPVQTPVPSKPEKSWEPGPAAGSTFTEQEISRIKPPQPKARPASQLATQPATRRAR